MSGFTTLKLKKPTVPYRYVAGRLDVPGPMQSIQRIRMNIDSLLFIRNFSLLLRCRDHAWYIYSTEKMGDSKKVAGRQKKDVLA